MTDKPIDAEFVEARPVARQPEPHRCHCPACRNVIANGNFCDACMATCVPALRQIHAHQPALARSQADTRTIVDGIKATARMVDGVGSILGAINGKPRRRRLR